MEEVTGQSRKLLWLLRKVIGEERAKTGLPRFTWKSEEKGALETASGGMAGLSFRCPLLSWLQVSWGPLEFNRR